MSLEEEKKVLNSLKKEYSEAKKQVKKKIEDLMNRGDADLPHVIHQIKYQKALQSQIDEALSKLKKGEYKTLSDYMEDSYGTGFTSSLYRLQKQGVPLLFPIDKNEVLRAVQTNSKISGGLYKRLGINTRAMKNAIRQEVTRGISSSMSFSDIARNIDNRMNSGLKNSYRIARTEGHRINQEASYDAMSKAKEAGADVVKQWDSTLDGRTRPHHRELNGQIRELDEPFEVAGLQAQHPSAFGKASEDINCRCVVLEVGRWELDEEDTFTKMGNEDGVIYEIKTSNYEEFKKDYYSKIDSYKEVSKILEKNSPVSFREYMNIQKDPKNKVLFDHYVKAVYEKELTALADFKLYKSVNNQIDKSLIGLVTNDGLTIKSKSFHFISRVIGSISQKRTGISVKKCIKTLIHPQEIREKLDKNGQLSRKYIYEDIEVSLNPETMNLIQCNPRRRKKK